MADEETEARHLVYVYFKDGGIATLSFASPYNRDAGYAQLQLVMSGNAYLQDDTGFRLTCKLDHIVACSVAKELDGPTDPIRKPN